MYTLEITLDVLYAPTTNGATGITGPQQTNGNSLIILYLICSIAKRSLMNNSLLQFYVISSVSFVRVFGAERGTTAIISIQQSDRWRHIVNLEENPLSHHFCVLHYA